MEKIEGINSSMWSFKLNFDLKYQSYKNLANENLQKIINLKKDVEELLKSWEVCQFVKEDLRGRHSLLEQNKKNIKNNEFILKDLNSKFEYNDKMVWLN